MESCLETSGVRETDYVLRLCCKHCIWAILTFSMSLFSLARNLLLNAVQWFNTGSRTANKCLSPWNEWLESKYSDLGPCRGSVELRYISFIHRYSVQTFENTRRFMHTCHFLLQTRRNLLWKHQHGQSCSFQDSWERAHVLREARSEAGHNWHAKD